MRMSHIYIRCHTKTVVALHSDGEDIIDINLDQGYLPVGSIIVGRVVKKTAGFYHIDIGASVPGILFDKAQNVQEGQLLPVQIKKHPQKERFDTKPYSLTDLLSLSNEYMTVTPRKKGIHLSSTLKDKDWRKKITASLQDYTMDVSVHLGERSYTQSVEHIINDIESLRHKATALYAQDLHGCKVGTIIHEVQPALVAAVNRMRQNDPRAEIVSDDANVVALLSTHGIESQFALKPHWVHHFDEALSSLLSPMVQIPGGGVMVIEEGQALTAIDVNTSTGSLPSSYTPVTIKSEHDLFEFAKVALNEAIRHVYLRRIGGIVLLDLPRLQNKKHQTALEKIAKSYEGQGLQVLGPTKSGLFEFTKKSEGGSLSQRLASSKGGLP